MQDPWVAGAGAEHSAAKEPLHDTVRVLVPLPQVLEQALHAVAFHVQPLVSTQASCCIQLLLTTSSGVMQSVGLPEGQLTWR